MWEGIRYIVELIYPRGAPHLHAVGTHLSLHRGRLFYSRGLRGIIDALLDRMGVHIKVSWCVDAFGCLCQMPRFCVSTMDNTGTLIIHSSSIHSASTHHPLIIHTWTHSRDTSTGHSKCTYICTTRTHTIYSLLPVRPVFECSLARPWHVLSKNLCASSLVFMRAPRLSVNYFNFYSKKACM